MKTNRHGFFILVSLLALSSLACSLSGLIPGVGGSNSSSGTVANLWPDVPKMDGITVIQQDMPLEFQLAVQAFFAAASGNQGSINFIAYTTDKTPADVVAYYSADRMKTAGWGRIIFISSESAVQIPSEMIHYGMTKTAQLAISRGLAETTTGTGVTVNAVLPGPTASEGVEGFVDNMAAARGADRSTIEREFFQNVRPSSLLRRFATPEEVAAMVTFVASPLSAATNGAALRVDGGVVRSII